MFEGDYTQLPARGQLVIRALGSLPTVARVTIDPFVHRVETVEAESFLTITAVKSGLIGEVVLSYDHQHDRYVLMVRRALGCNQETFVASIRETVQCLTTVSPLVFQLSPVSIGSYSAFTSLVRRHRVAELAAIEESLICQGVSLGSWLRTRLVHGRSALFAAASESLQSAGCTLSRARSRAVAFEQTLGILELVDPAGTPHFDTIAPTTIATWIEHHNGYMQAIGLHDRVARMLGEPALPENLNHLVVPGLKRTLRRAPYRALYARRYLDLALYDLRLGKKCRSLVEEAAIDQEAVQAGLSAYTAIAICIAACSIDAAAAAIQKMLARHRIGNQYRLLLRAYRIARAAQYRCSIHYATELERPTYVINSKQIERILRNDSVLRCAARQALPVATG